MRCFGGDAGVILEVVLPGKAEEVTWRITWGRGEADAPHFPGEGDVTQALSAQEGDPRI